MVHKRDRVGRTRLETGDLSLCGAGSDICHFFSVQEEICRLHGIRRQRPGYGDGILICRQLIRRPCCADLVRAYGISIDLYVIQIIIRGNLFAQEPLQGAAVQDFSVPCAALFFIRLCSVDIQGHFAVLEYC